MRWLVLTVAFVGLCGAAQAQEPLARPMERTPSIMVGGETATPSRTVKRQQATRPRSSRPVRTRPTPLPSASSRYEAETRSINSSISRQQEQLQTQQRQRVENNLNRQQIQRSINTPLIGTSVRPLSPGCQPGLIGC
jgi:hypothetical protein